MLAAWVAGPFWSSAAVAPPGALPWMVPGVAVIGQGERVLVQVLHERIEELEAARHRERFIGRVRHHLVAVVLDLDEVARRSRRPGASRSFASFKPSAGIDDRSARG